MNPKQSENKYKRGQIYKVISSNCNDVYVGSTYDNLRKRLNGHVSDYKRYLDGIRGFITSGKIIEKGNYDIVLIEKYPCKDKAELHARERHWIENTPNCVNKCIPTRNKKQYYIQKKVAINARGKRYYRINQVKISEQKRQYRITNQEKLKQGKDSTT